MQVNIWKGESLVCDGCDKPQLPVNIVMFTEVSRWFCVRCRRDLGNALLMSTSNEPSQQQTSAT
jgi:hypothetical protein